MVLISWYLMPTFQFQRLFVPFIKRSKTHPEITSGCVSKVQIDDDDDDDNDGYNKCFDFFKVFQSFLALHQHNGVIVTTYSRPPTPQRCAVYCSSVSSLTL